MDPDCIFSNFRFKQYILPLYTQAYRTKWSKANVERNIKTRLDGFKLLRSDALQNQRKGIMDEKKFLTKLPQRNQKNFLRRSQSYRSLLRSKDLRDQFREQLLGQIFNLAIPVASDVKSSMGSCE